jgi:hypothetical protein
MTVNRRPYCRVLVVAVLGVLATLPIRAADTHQARSGSPWLELLHWFLPERLADFTRPQVGSEVLPAGGSWDPNGGSAATEPPGWLTVAREEASSGGH